VLEGERLVGDALTAGYGIETLLVAEDRMQGHGRVAALVESAGGALRCVGPELLARVSGLSTSPGLLALCHVPETRSLDGLNALAEDGEALVVVAAGVQDPGNLGAIARVTEAAGARALVTTDGGCRPWNPKAMRGSMGSFLRLATVEGGAPGAVWDGLAERGVRAVVASTRGGVSLGAFDWSGRVALWLSSESGEWPAELASKAKGADAVTIPMAGAVESLNVAVAAGVLLFAAGRTGTGDLEP